ncbi:uncharacterized protein LOC124364851 isoform X1 [Homalodisca vitripennis]|uniref:uncharacterized protein LOC124364851 isoform X1 n=1 Tax=Homalodisca vitripennis TaxID=197043 RepID=UPI001EEA8315|nr:uncharacterized protein LOC124364851 isoform X1 [Homalodisca vitripennis]
MVDPSRRKYISQRTFETRSTSLSLTIMHSCQMKKKVMLWNVRGSPVYVRDPMNLLFESEGYMFVQMINPNMMLIVQGLSVQVYCFKSILDESWELKHIFFLDGTESVSSSEAQNCQSELGASVETIVSSLTVKMPTKEVEKILEFLASEGHVYSPSDDRHYKATDSFN